MFYRFNLLSQPLRLQTSCYKVLATSFGDYVWTVLD